MTMRVLRDEILVKQKIEEKTAAGIYLTEKYQKQSGEGIVHLIGPKVLDVKVGDNVLFNKLAGRYINFEKEEFILMRENEIWGIREK